MRKQCATLLLTLNTSRSIQLPSNHQSNLRSMSTCQKKRLIFLRHGQAFHNPRAEEAKSNGCSHDRFLEIMQEDDQFDADLTKIGIEQALKGKAVNQDRLLDVDLVVSSPLSRALKTADLTICPKEDGPKRICIEELREINGWLLNAKRRKKSELQQIFHQRWNFDSLSEEDETWTQEMEKYEDCGERGYQALLFLYRRKEDKILAVAHGGILRFSLVDHPLIKLVDGRDDKTKRFSNCEMREYEISHDINGGTSERPVIILTEITAEA